MTAADGPAVNALLDIAFGPERHGRTAYRLRAGMEMIEPLCFVATATDGLLLGSIQCWPVALHWSGGAVPLVQLGPLGVDPAVQGIGIGRALLHQAVDAADRGGEGLMTLIGDQPYYGPFGFSVDGTAGWQVPGPVDRDRLLVRNPAGLSLPAVGHLGPRLEKTAAVA